MDLYYGIDSKYSQNAYKIAQITIDELATKLKLKVVVDEINGVKSNLVCDEKNNIIFENDSPLAIYYFLQGMLNINKK